MLQHHRSTDLIGLGFGILRNVLLFLISNTLLEFVFDYFVIVSITMCSSSVLSIIILLLTIKRKRSTGMSKTTFT